MGRRIAAAMSLLAFALCVTLGIIAENDAVTILSRALMAMAVTFIVGMVIGAMAQRMLDEHLSAREKNAEIEESQSAPHDR